MKNLLLAFCCLLSGQSFAQKTKTENLIIVTLDGMRWQEIFGGIDSQIVVNHKFTRDSASVTGLFGASERNERRKKLFPFLWGTVAVQGQLYGDRLNGSEVNNANPYKFSYPGYNEIFTGYPDTNVNSNDKIKNPNTQECAGVHCKTKRI